MTLPMRGLVTAVCLFILAACGGGGGGGAGGGGAGTPGGGGSGGGGNSPPTGAPGYVGSTTAVDLSSSSVVPPLSGWLLLELGLTEGLNSGSIATAKPSQSSMQKRFGKVRERAVALASRMTIQAVTTEACGLSGTTEINDDGLRADGTGLVVFTFRDCAEGDGTTLNGVVRVTIAATDTTLFEPTDYTVNFENARVTAGADSVEAGGSVHVVVTDTAVTTTRNTVARYLPDNVYLRLQDFVVTESSDEHGPGLTYRGRFYHSQYGYVDVQAPFPLRYDTTWGGVLLSGTMQLMGAPAGARVDLRFRERDLVSVVVDLNSDGVPERGLSARPSDLFRPDDAWAPMADAGSDLNVEEGDLVTFDASDNRDWEGRPLTFAWSFNHTPVGAGSFPAGSGSTYSFTPTVPGFYTLDLFVTDSSGRWASDQVVVQVYDIPGPYANAGVDRTTVERSTITLDGSRTIPASGSVDALQFAWTLVSAPPNSSAPATLSGMSPQLTVDLLGQYTYRLTVSGRGGTSSDTVTIVAAPLLTATPGSFNISLTTTAAATTLQMPVRLTSGYTGSQLPATISSDADWLTIDTPNITTATTSVTVRLDLDALASLPAGSHRGTVRILPSGYSEWSGQFSLQLDLPSVRQVSPYVVYTGQATTVNLLGEQLNQAADRLFLNNTRITGLTRVSTSKARVELPALTPGEYTVNVPNALGVARPAGRLVVRDAPVHPVGEVTLPGYPIAIEYDPERDVFYGVFIDAATPIARRFHRQANGTWQFDPISVTEPRALMLGLGGERLFVSTNRCGVHEVDAVTLQVLVPATARGCMTQQRGVIAALADGEVVIGDTNQWSDLWRYPEFTLVPGAPSIYGAIGVVSHDRSRMLWAQEAAITPPHSLYVLDVLGGPVDATPSWSGVTVRDSETYLTTSNLAISGDGSRFMHREDVYNNSYQYVGSLQGLSNRNLTPAVSRRGTRAVVYDGLADQMKLFDVSSGNSFPLLGVIDTFATEVDSLRLAYYPDDAAVFMWGRVRTGTSNGLPTYEYRMFVREVP